VISQALVRRPEPIEWVEPAETPVATVESAPALLPH
jgi:hypothetical protein